VDTRPLKALAEIVKEPLRLAFGQPPGPSMRERAGAGSKIIAVDGMVSVMVHTGRL
jgi:hypothetical protein